MLTNPLVCNFTIYCTLFHLLLNPLRILPLGWVGCTPVLFDGQAVGPLSRSGQVLFTRTPQTFYFFLWRFSELLQNRFRWFGKSVKAGTEKCGWVNGVVRKWQSKCFLPLKKLAGFEKRKSIKLCWCAMKTYLVGTREFRAIPCSTGLVGCSGSLPAGFESIREFHYVSLAKGSPGEYTV